MGIVSYRFLSKSRLIKPISMAMTTATIITISIVETAEVSLEATAASVTASDASAAELP